MKMTERTLRISAASFLALLMVGASYLLSGPNFFTDRIANAGSTEELLKTYSTKDTDADGLPDWQEALYGTDPNKSDTDGDGITDGEAARQGKLTPTSLASQLPSAEQGTTSPQDILADIPGVDPAEGSITEQFSQQFLQDIVSASQGQALTDEQKQELSTKLFAEYAGKSAALFKSRYSLVSLHTDTSISTNAYAGSVEQIFFAHDVSADANQPLVLMDALVQNEDESARTKLKKLADSYGAITADLIAIPVPPQLADEHLALIQAFDSLHKATAAVAVFEKDPLGVMGGLAMFQPASVQVVVTIKAIATSVLASGEPAAGMPGSVLVNIARSTETQ